MDFSPVESYLLQLDQQLPAALRDLAAVDDLSLWARPAPKEWSPGEHFSHVAAVHHFFRRVNQLLWPISSRMARLGLHHPYQAIIDDVCARPAFPHAIGRLWHPRHSYRRPVSLLRLTGEIGEEHRLLRAFYGRGANRSSVMPLFTTLRSPGSTSRSPCGSPCSTTPITLLPSGRRSPRTGVRIRTSPDITLARGS